MVRILKTVIVTTTGTIVRDYEKVADELGICLVSDPEVERQYLIDSYTALGYTVERVNLTYESQ